MTQRGETRRRRAGSRWKEEGAASEGDAPRGGPADGGSVIGLAIGDSTVVRQQHHWARWRHWARWWSKCGISNSGGVEEHRSEHHAFRTVSGMAIVWAGFPV